MTRPARSVKERSEEGSDAENNVTDVDAAKAKTAAGIRLS